MYHTSTVDIVQCNLFSEYDALIKNHGIPLKSFHMLHGYYDIILLTVCQACKKKNYLLWNSMPIKIFQATTKNKKAQSNFFE